MNIIFERPTLNRKTAEENLAIVDRWIADTVDKLNALNVSEGSKKSDNDDVPTKLSELQDDSGHRTVSDTEKASWNNKADKSKAYSIDDQTGTISNNDYIPFSSTGGKKKTLWSDIKAALKTYFDAIYSTFSGSYNDLTDKPTIPAAQVNSDWNSSSGVSKILNKPTLATVATSGSYSDLVDEPTNQSAQQYSSTVSLCTRHEKYTWNSAYNNMVKWFVSTGFAGATSVSITIGVLSDYGLSGAIVSMLADNGTNKPVKYKTAEIIVGSGSVPDSIYITCPALEYNTTFKIGLL